MIWPVSIQAGDDSCVHVLGDSEEEEEEEEERRLYANSENLQSQLRVLQLRVPGIAGVYCLGHKPATI